MSPEPADPWSSGDRADDGSIPPLPGSPSDPLGAAELQIPDDARELARDFKAWQREVRWNRRRQRFERWTGRDVRDRDLRGRQVSGTVVVAIVLLVGLIGATLVVFTPRNVRRPVPPVPLALAAPTQAAGAVGGLLPAADLTTNVGGVVHARDLRPTVLALIPANCRCATALKELVTEAGESGLLPVELVSTASQASQLAALTDDVGDRLVVPLRDIQSALVDPIAPLGLTVVAVHSDGVIETIVRNFSGDTSLVASLHQLSQPGFSTNEAPTTSP
jgi:hypothetical protein